MHCGHISPLSPLPPRLQTELLNHAHHCLENKPTPRPPPAQRVGSGQPLLFQREDTFILHAAATHALPTDCTHPKFHQKRVITTNQSQFLQTLHPSPCNNPSQGPTASLDGRLQIAIMTRSKSNTDRPCYLSYSRPTSSCSILEPVREEVEPVARSRSVAKMATLQKPPSRLNRLSQYLPAILTNNDAKLQKDQQPVLRKPMPSPSPSPFDATAQGPPTRPPPSAPAQHDMMPPPPPNPQKLHKQHTPPIQMTTPRDSSPSPHSLEGRRPRANSLLPPQPNNMGQPRSVSSPMTSRPVSTNLSDSETDGKLRKRRSWLPGAGKSRSRNPSQDLDQNASLAWVLAGGHQIDYNLNFLLAGDKVRSGTC